MLLPNENESNFMRLNSITSEKDDYITLYSAKSYSENRLAVFNTLVYYDFLNIDYVTDIEYTFLQVPGYVFTIKEYERESTNSGWLIKDWQEISFSDKEKLLQRIYYGKYPSVEPITSANEALDNLPTTDATAGIEIVEKFVEYLNDFIVGNVSIEDIHNIVKGRYTFIISDEISNQLSKFYKTKSQESYRLNTLLGWLSKTDLPIKSIHITNPEHFINENIKTQYAKEFILIKCDLSTTGDIQINEKVVFFIYGKQIAGIKLISDCI